MNLTTRPFFRRAARSRAATHRACFPRANACSSRAARHLAPASRLCRHTRRARSPRTLAWSNVTAASSKPPPVCAGTMLFEKAANECNLRLSTWSTTTAAAVSAAAPVTPFCPSQTMGSSATWRISVGVPSATPKGGWAEGLIVAPKSSIYKAAAAHARLLV
eukprot:scaffold67235_cov61-Phaeocystis_antarctica.AAC.1